MYTFCFHCTYIYITLTSLILVWCDVMWDVDFGGTSAWEKIIFFDITQTNSLLSYLRHFQCSSWSRRSPRPADCPAGKTKFLLSWLFGMWYFNKARFFEEKEVSRTSQSYTLYPVSTLLTALMKIKKRRRWKRSKRSSYAQRCQQRVLELCTLTRSVLASQCYRREKKIIWAISDADGVTDCQTDLTSSNKNYLEVSKNLIPYPVFSKNEKNLK